jgi:hypothetical protein
MRLKPYIATVVDPEGDTHQYLFDARTLRGARRQAREWVARTDWGASFVGIEPGIGSRRHARHRRLMAVAGVTLVVSGTTIAALMLIGLSLEGAL